MLWLIEHGGVQPDDLAQVIHRCPSLLTAPAMQLAACVMFLKRVAMVKEVGQLVTQVSYRCVPDFATIAVRN